MGDRFKAILLLPALWLLCAPDVSLAQSAAAPPSEELIAVLDLRGVQTSQGEVAALTNRLREVLLKSGRYTLVNRGQMDAILSEQALQQTACTDEGCAVQVGRILGVRKIVVGEIVKISDSIWLLSALMVDVETAETLRAESIRHRGDFFTLMDQRINDLGVALGRVGTSAAASGAPVASARMEPAPPTSADRAVNPDSQAGEMVALPGGEFLMGRESGVFGSADSEPVHPVRLRPFRLDVLEVTQLQFERVMGFNPSAFRDARFPVDSVTWEHASAYCRKVGKRLPTEAEWEYAARAGTDTAFSFGDNDFLMRSYGNTCGFGCSGESSGHGSNEQDGWSEVAPSGSFRPNQWGLHDMHGNVAEWVADWYGPYQQLAQDNPTGPGFGTEKVTRGGSWRDWPDAARSTARASNRPDTTSSTIGFRCAADGGG